ncbi:branched chain amino acid aminotransferase [Alteribacter lacisalsi]|uniref:Branched-chain-amino-acid aminotransferase n=1 Tax=Alteribacter lacisalsi TaxID=2045244 RepID=A0A2W0H6V6_9BACI|nr:branched-chain amino acid transaminase [Alteribacter lacisalsi]PYZ97584.1 branched chain amino acid aminotransferase [Alteribacter lacisalsi]
MAMYTFMNGKFIPDEEASVPIRNKALNYGLGIIEGIRGYWNPDHKQLYVFRLTLHYERLLEACRALAIDIPYTASQLSEITVELIKINNVKRNIYIRPFAFIDQESLRPSLINEQYGLTIALVEPGIYAFNELKTLTSSWLRITTNTIPSQLKTSAGYMNSALAYSDAVRSGADEAILLTREGNLSEASTSNLFVVRGDHILTPQASDDIFPGITRSTVLTLAEDDPSLTWEITTLPKTSLYTADEVFLTGTAIQIVSVVSADFRQVGSGITGPVTAYLQKSYMDIVHGKVPNRFNWLTAVY